MLSSVNLSVLRLDDKISNQEGTILRATILGILTIAAAHASGINDSVTGAQAFDPGTVSVMACCGGFVALLWTKRRERAFRKSDVELSTKLSNTMRFETMRVDDSKSQY